MPGESRTHWSCCPWASEAGNAEHCSGHSWKDQLIIEKTNSGWDSFREGLRQWSGKWWRGSWTPGPALCDSSRLGKPGLGKSVRYCIRSVILSYVSCLCCWVVVGYTAWTDNPAGDLSIPLRHTVGLLSLPETWLKSSGKSVGNAQQQQQFVKGETDERNGALSHGKTGRAACSTFNTTPLLYPLT